NSKSGGYLGVISIASPSSQHLTQDFELISIFRLLLDEEVDHAMLLDMEGRVLFATPNISPYLKTSNNTDLALTDHIFFDLLDHDNEIVARRSWDGFLEHPEDGRKLLLKLQDNNLQNRIIEFSYQSIYSTFKKKLICLSGRVVSKRSSSEVFLEQSNVLQTLFKSPEHMPQEDYHKLLDIAMKLVPGAQFAALLEKTHLGYQFCSGIGLETSQLQDLVLLDKTTVRRLKALDELAGIDETVRRVLLNETRDKLFSVLPDARRELIMNQGRLGSTDELLLGKIRLSGESHSLIVLGTSGEDSHFSEKDMFLLQLLLKQSSVLLSNAIMSKELAESNQNYHQLLQHAPLACFVVQENRIRSFNPFFKDMLGYEQDEMLVRDLWRHLHPDDLQRFQMDIAAVTERYSVMDMEIRLIDKQKQELFCSGALLRVNRNQQPAVLCIAFDQTRLHMLEEKIVETEQGEATSSMLAGIVHDFNNILGVTLGTAELIKGADPRERDELADQIIRVAQQGASLTNQLLSFSG
ncbi:MAG: PAS domain S-box protein, partial [Calditrichota bacterium]